MIRSYLLIASSFLFFTGCVKKVNENILPDLKFNSDHIDIADFSLERDEKTSHARYLDLKNKDKTLLRIKITEVKNSAEAKKKIQHKAEEIKLMYAPQYVPYQGVISRSMTCLSAVELNHKLAETDKELDVYFNLTATGTLVYASCLPDQEIYKSQYLLIYCKSSNSIYEIKYFYDKNKDYYAPVASCK